MKYKIKVTETLRRTFEIEANSAEEAEEQLFSDYPWSDEAPDISVDEIKEDAEQ